MPVLLYRDAATGHSIHHHRHHILNHRRPDRKGRVADNQHLPVFIAAQITGGEIRRNNDRHTDLLFIHSGAGRGFVGVVAGCNPGLDALVEKHRADVFANRSGQHAISGEFVGIDHAHFDGRHAHVAAFHPAKGEINQSRQ